MTPTQRSLKKLRGEGGLVAVVERWNPHAMIRQDLFGIFDLLVVRGDCVIGVQTTSGSNVAARVEKMRQNPNLAQWLASSSRSAIVHGWRKVGARGKRKLWECREVDLRGEQGTAVKIETLTGANA